VATCADRLTRLLWLGATLPLFVCSPQSAPASGPDLLKSEARLRQLSIEIEAAAADTNKPAAERVGELARLGREMAGIAVAVSQQSAVHAIRAEESLRLDLQKAEGEAAAAQDALRERAEELALRLGDLLAKARANPNPNVASAELDAGLAAARDQWRSAAVSASEALGKLDALRVDAVAKHTDSKRLATRIARDAITRLQRARQPIGRTDVALLDSLEPLFAEAEAKGNVAFERGRLAQERALQQLGGALAQRTEALTQAQLKLDEGVAAIVAARAGGAESWEKRIQQWLAESAEALKQLAAGNRVALESRADAIRRFWAQADPEARARVLDPADRERMLQDRSADHEELQRTAEELEALNRRLAELRARARVD